MRKKHVLIISNMYPSKKSATFGIFVKNQVDALIREGFQVEVLAIRNPSTKKTVVLSKYFLWFINGLILLFKGYKYDIVHVHYVFPSGLIGMLFKLIWRSKLMVTAHGSDINKMARKNRFIHRLTSLILHKADRIITVGQGLFLEIENDFKIDSKKMTLLSMGVNREIFRKMFDKSMMKKKLEIDENEQVILFVGNIIRDKGLLDLIKAFSIVKNKYPKTGLHIIGAAKNKPFLEEFYSIMEKDQIKGVTFHGVKSQKEVAEWMNAADIFVLPSYIEGFGLVALEAMACGTPVVASNVGGLTSLLSNESGILVPRADHQSLSEGIISVLSNKGLRNLLIQNAMKKAEEHDQKNIINQLKEIYQR